MNNLYNLVNNFDFYFEAFRNIESNKTFVVANDYKENFIGFINLLLAIRRQSDEEKKVNLLEKIKENYNSFLEILNGLSNDKVFYEKNNSRFSIDLKQEDIKKFEELYEEMLKDPTENVIDLINFIERELKIKIFTVTINNEATEKGFNVYTIVFRNLKSQTNAPENSGEKGLISKNFRIIFGIILEYAKKLNIDFDKSIFHFSGTTEGKKDKDTNRRLKAYHMAHKGFLKMQYNDIDEKELSNAFKNNEIHPFLYRPNKDEMYISVSKDVDLTKVLEKQDELHEVRQEAWPEFVEDYLQSDEGLEEIKKNFINLLDRDVKEFMEILFPLENELEILITKVEIILRDIKDKMHDIQDTIQTVFDGNFTSDEYINNEKIVNIIKENSLETEILDLMEGNSSNISEIFSLLKVITEKNTNYSTNELIQDIVYETVNDAIEKVEYYFIDKHYDYFMNGEYDEWIMERI